MHVEPSCVLDALLLDPGCRLRAQNALIGTVEPVELGEKKGPGVVVGCFGDGSGGPQMPHESEQAASAATQCHTAARQRRWKDPIHTHTDDPPPPPGSCI